MGMSCVIVLCRYVFMFHTARLFRWPPSSGRTPSGRQPGLLDVLRSAPHSRYPSKYSPRYYMQYIQERVWVLTWCSLGIACTHQILNSHRCKCWTHNHLLSEIYKMSLSLEWFYAPLCALCRSVAGTIHSCTTMYTVSLNVRFDIRGFLLNWWDAPPPVSTSCWFPNSLG